MNEIAPLETVSKMEKAYNTRDETGFLEAFAESAVLHDPTMPEPLRGHEAIGDWFRKSFGIFPDLKWERLRAFAEEALVAVEYEESGTHKGPFPGPGDQMVRPTGKQFRHRMACIFQIVDGRITELRVYFDVLGVMAQLGLTG